MTRIRTAASLGALLALTAAMVSNTAAARAMRQTTQCTIVGNTSDTAQWQSLQGGIHFAVRWNPQFQSHELLWANRARRNVRVEYVVQPRSGAAAAGARFLPAGSQETLPGQSVRPSEAGAVCLELARAAH